MNGPQPVSLTPYLICSPGDADLGRELAARGEGELAQPHLPPADQGQRRRRRRRLATAAAVVSVVVVVTRRLRFEEQTQMVQGRQGKNRVRGAIGYVCLGQIPEDLFSSLIRLRMH